MSEHLPPERRPAAPQPHGAPLPVTRDVMHGDIVEYSIPTRAQTMAGVDGGAITALVLAILSWMMLPVVGALAALVIAPGAKRRIRDAGGALGSTSIVTAAQIIAGLNILTCLAFAALIVAVLKALF